MIEITERQEYDFPDTIDPAYVHIGKITSSRGTVEIEARFAEYGKNHYEGVLRFVSPSDPNATQLVFTHSLRNKLPTKAIYAWDGSRDEWRLR